MKSYAIFAFKSIILTGFLLTPLFYWPWIPIAYEVPKVWLILRWIEFTALFSIIFYPYIIQKEKYDLRLIIILLIYLAVSVTTSLTGSDPGRSFWGNYYRIDGLFTLLHLTIFFVMFSLFYRKNLYRQLNMAIGLSVFILSIWVSLEGFLYWVIKLKNIIPWEGAFGGPFGNPNFLGGYLLITVPLVYSLYKKSISKWKMFWSVTLLLTIPAIILTQSRAAILIITLTIIYLAVRNKKISIKKSLILLSIMMLFVLSLLTIRNNRSQDKFIAEGRVRIFTKGFLAFLEKPFLGWGWSNFDHAFESVDWPIKIEKDVYVDKGHSSILENLVTTGIFGLSLYILLISKTALNLYKNKSLRDPYFYTFIILIVHSQTNIISISEELLFWLLAAISVKKS